MNNILNKLKLPTHQIYQYLLPILFIGLSDDLIFYINISGQKLKLLPIICTFIAFIYLLKSNYRKICQNLFPWSAILIFLLLETYHYSETNEFKLYYFSVAAIVFSFASLCTPFAFPQIKINIYQFTTISTVILFSITIIQFLMGVLNLNPNFIQQWWIPGLIPRINCLTSEPSYNAIVILYLFYVSFYLFKKNENKMNIKIIYMLLFSAILNSSRILYIFIFLTILIDILLNYLRKMSQKKSVKFLFIFLFSTIVYSIFIQSFINYAPSSQSIVNGLGLTKNSYSHSFSDRLKRASETLSIIKEHPIIGYGYGLSSKAIWNKFHNSEEFNRANNHPIFTFLEIQASYGVFGSLLFILLLIKLFKLYYQTEDKFIINALLASLLIASINQGFLNKNYIWLLIGLTFKLTKNNTNSTEAE